MVLRILMLMFQTVCDVTQLNRNLYCNTDCVSDFSLRLESKFGYDVTKGNILCRYKRMSFYPRNIYNIMVNSEELIDPTEYLTV